MSWAEWEDCPDCKGKGGISGEPCDSCFGEGRLPVASSWIDDGQDNG